MKTVQNQPVCNCRICAEPMDAVWQEALLPGRDGMLLITCETEHCPMNAYTFSLRNYVTMSLAAYLPATANEETVAAEYQKYASNMAEWSKELR